MTCHGDLWCQMTIDGDYGDHGDTDGETSHGEKNM